LWQAQNNAKREAQPQGNGWLCFSHYTREKITLPLMIPLNFMIISSIFLKTFLIPLFSLYFF
jgi:hypothetical protein